jgi:hypothetical protein
MIYSRFEDSTDIDWDMNPPLISDMSDSVCFNDLRFRKVHLQEVAKKLWPLMEPHLEGNYDRIRLQNGYTLPFKTCLMILLYRLAAPHRIRPDMERFFAIRKSRISAALNTFVDAMYETALPYLSSPALFQHCFSLYSQLIFEKCNAANMMWGFIDGTHASKNLPSDPFSGGGIQRSQAHSCHQVSIGCYTRQVDCFFIWAHSRRTS